MKTFWKPKYKKYNKPLSTLRSLPVHPTSQKGIAFHMACDEGEKDYIGESARLQGTRLKGHLSTKRSSSTGVWEHCKHSGHRIPKENTKSWQIKLIPSDFQRNGEALLIMQKYPSLNIKTRNEFPRLYWATFMSCKVENRPRKPWDLSSLQQSAWIKISPQILKKKLVRQSFKFGHVQVRVSLSFT